MPPRRVSVPAYAPQLAQLVDQAPEGERWAHEIKLDGYRIGCRIEGRAIVLVSRNGLDWTTRFPEIVEAVKTIDVRAALLDGEVALVDARGRTSFQALQNAFGDRGRAGLRYFLFDLLAWDGRDLRAAPLRERKATLERVLKNAPRTLVYVPHVTGSGADVLREACRLGLEGIVSKRMDEPYRAGRRPTWVKTKCTRRQELVIGGFTDPEGSREGIGALLVGYYASSRLVFAGRVGTGFTRESARALRRKLDAIERDTPPFSPAPRGRLGSHTHWVEPTLVAEVAFTEWTAGGSIRHPSFQALREDKSSESVVRESDVPVIRSDTEGSARQASPRARDGGRASEAKASTPAVVKRSRAAVPAAATDGERVTITHPARVVYPEAGLTKQDVADYYRAIGEHMLPHVLGRPLTLVRCPSGRDASCFYVKHSSVWAPPSLRRVRISEKTKTGEYLVAESLDALIGLVQMNVLEIHTWNSTIAALETPDRLVFDLDPGPDVAWTAVVDAARLVKRLLDDVGLASFPKTTGGRGLHLVVPLVPVASWATCLEFARGVAETLERSDPARYTTAYRKAGRERKILIDYLRNSRTNTSIAAFSTRARPNAPVSMPVRWDEVTPALDPASFSLKTGPSRVRRQRRDPWAAYWTARQKL